MTSSTCLRAQGVEVLTKACDACKTAIDQHKGRLMVKEAARAVTGAHPLVLAEKFSQFMTFPTAGDAYSCSCADALRGLCRLHHRRRCCVWRALRASSNLVHIATSVCPCCHVERDDRMLMEQLTALEAANKEVAGDTDSEDDDDTGMGDVDISAPPALSA